jgi:hypothetical protein
LPDPVRFYGWGFLFYDIFMIMETNKIISEELSRMKSLIGYQKGVVISEQTTPNQQKALAMGFGPVSAQYAEQLASQGKLSGEKTRQEVINSIYCGIDASGKLTAPGWQGKTFDEYSQGLTEPVTAAELATAKASCPTIKTALQTSTPTVTPTNTTTKKAPSTPPCSLPPELKDAEGVKSFQDWLDTNKAGWATGYKEGILKQGTNGGGYGKFGPRTCKAWKYKNEYLNKSTEVKTGYEEYGGVSGDNKPAGNVNQTQTGNAGQTPAGNVNQTQTGNAGQTPAGNVNQTPTANTVQTPTGGNLEQMPLRDVDYFKEYQ